MTFEPMGIVEFGRMLVDSEDLDPLYVGLLHSGMDQPTLTRWLISYWCYYNAGLSCWIVDEGPDKFWDTMAKVAVGGTEYPRGTERRHFRGHLAIETIRRLRATFPSPLDMLMYLLDGRPTASEMMKRVKNLYGFGEWVKWKVPDMIDRLEICPVEFTEADLIHMFDSSKKGAAATSERYRLEPTLVAAHRFVLRAMGTRLAPPLYDRRLNVQETETIFCKWKSHLGGHYPLGKDTHEIGLGLRRYGECPTTQALLRGLRNVKGGV